MTTAAILRRVLVYTGVLALILAVGGGLIGYLTAGINGLWSVLLGTVVAVAFSAITAASLWAAIKFDIILFFGIVMGSWLVKMVLFIVALLLLRDQPFIEPLPLFLALVVAIVGTVTIDAIVVVRSRMSYVSDAATPEPGEQSQV